MEIKGKVHCFFEQSATFRDEFRKLGYESFDYDIQNSFGKTDYQIDLFVEIEKAYDEEESIFNNITKDDLIDKDRTKRGDYFKKPTAYWFVNCKPTNGRSYQKPIQTKTIMKSKMGKKAGICSEERSMISPDYARNFICDFILGKVQKHTQLDLNKRE